MDEWNEESSPANGMNQTERETKQPRCAASQSKRIKQTTNSSIQKERIDEIGLVLLSFAAGVFLFSLLIH